MLWYWDKGEIERLVPLSPKGTTPLFIATTNSQANFYAKSNFHLIWRIPGVSSFVSKVAECKNGCITLYNMALAMSKYKYEVLAVPSLTRGLLSPLIESAAPKYYSASGRAAITTSRPKTVHSTSLKFTTGTFFPSTFLPSGLTLTPPLPR